LVTFEYQAEYKVWWLKTDPVLRVQTQHMDTVQMAQLDRV